MEPPRGYFDNFLLKVNGKIGGQNAVLDPVLLKNLPFNMQRTYVFKLKFKVFFIDLFSPYLA